AANRKKFLVDSKGMAQAEIRAVELNHKEAADVEKDWELDLKRSLLLEEVERLMYSFQLIDSVGGDLIDHNVQILSAVESWNDGTHHFDMSLAARRSEEH